MDFHEIGPGAHLKMLAASETGLLVSRGFGHGPLANLRAFTIGADDPARFNGQAVAGKLTGAEHGDFCAPGESCAQVRGPLGQLGVQNRAAHGQPATTREGGFDRGVRGILEKANPLEGRPRETCL